MKDSKAYYNQLAKTYDEQTHCRIHYLNAIDDYIVNHTKELQIRRYLDIGSGDGRRSLKIGKTINVSEAIVLIDNSPNMIKDVTVSDKVTVLNTSIFDFNTSMSFNLITCLWNVVGHFPSKELMIDLFKKVNLLLEKGGVFIFDVNNRYNISHYGYEHVEQNMKNDYLNIKDAGWFTLGKYPNQTKVYIHSPFDIYNYIESTDLELEAITYIDYTTGKAKATFFEGQLLYKLRKR